MSTIVQRPQSWAKARMVAGLRLIGATQVAAAKAAGVSEGTVVSWEASPWWPDLVREVRQTDILDRLVALAYRTMLDAVEQGDAQSARWILERLDTERFGPPRQGVDAEHSGAVEIVVTYEDADNEGD